MPHHYYSNPQLPRITRNLSRAILGSAQDDRAIAGARYDDARALGVERQNEFVNTLVEKPGLARHFLAKQFGVTPDELDAIAGDSLPAFSGRFFGGDNPQQLTQGTANALMTQPRIQAEQALANQRTASAGASNSLAGKYDAEARGAGADSDVKEQRRDAFAGFPDNAMIGDLILQARGINPKDATVEERANATQLGLAALTSTGSNAKGIIEALGLSAKTPIQIQQEEQQLAEDTEAVKTQEAKTSKELKGIEKIDAEIKNIEETRKKLEEQTQGQKINNANDALKQIGISLENSAKLVKVRQEKEKLLKLEIEKVTAQHGADSAEALALIRNETVNKVKLEQELAKIRVLNERKMGLAERQNLAAKTGLTRKQEEKVGEQITTIQELRPDQVREQTGKADLVEKKGETEGAKKTNLAELTNLVKSKIQTEDDLRPDRVREQTGKADLSEERVDTEGARKDNLVERTNLTKKRGETEDALRVPRVDATKALAEKRKSTTTSSGGTPLKVSAGDHKKFQALVQERRDKYENFDDIPEVVRINLRRKATDVFGDSFSGRAGETRGDFMKSANVGLDSLPEFNGDVHQIDTDFFDDVDDFAIPGHTYNELRKVFTLKGEEANKKAREWYDKLEEQGYTKEQITAIFNDVKP